MVSKVIGFGHISIFHLNVLLASAFYLLRSYAFLELKQYFSDWQDNHPIFLTLIMFLGESVVGIYVLIENIIIMRKRRLFFSTLENEKTMHQQQHIALSKITRIYGKKEIRVPLFIVIIGITLIEFCSFLGLQYLAIYYPNGSDLQTQIRSLKFIFDSIFCYLLLKIRIYRHHILSIFIIILGIFFVTILDVIKASYAYFLFFIFIFHSLIISIRDHIEKWVIDTKFKSAIRLLFYRGAIGSIISFTIGLILSMMSSTSSIFDSFALIFTSNSLVITWFIVYFICCIFYNLFYSIIKQYFTPAHAGVSDAFSTVMWMVILQMIPSSKKKVNWVLLAIGYILVVFGSVLYNDIVILYFCGLDHNTKIEVSNRGDRETTYNELEIFKDKSLLENDTEVRSLL